MPSINYCKLLVATLFLASTVFAQQPTPLLPADNASVSPALPTEVHIDQYCRVLTPGHPTATNPAPPAHYRYNSVVCHIESDLHSHHWEQKTINGTPRNTYVYVKEREYLLQNTTDRPVAFVVNQPLPKGWRIDSDPQPIDLQGSTATFRVIAEPGQIVRLHVGERS
jgi:hypothetical protein